MEPAARPSSQGPRESADTPVPRESAEAPVRPESAETPGPRDDADARSSPEGADRPLAREGAEARTAHERATLLQLSASELEARFVALGGKPFHARIARRELLGRGVLEYAAMSALPAALRARLAEELPLLSSRELERRVAADGTTKLLLELAARGGREARVETVHMPSLYADGSDADGGEDQDLPDLEARAQRRSAPQRARGATLCVSTQVGCPVGCPFCASGLAGLVRNLAAHEILEQFARGRALGPLARCVVMGIGEPLLNYDALASALESVQAEVGLGARKITVSTVGFPERLRRIAPTKPRFQLALSLHSADDAQRAELVPAMRDVPVEELLAAGDDWFRHTGREVTYEIVLLAGVNDAPAQAALAARRLAGRRCTVNLIPFNPVGESPFARPSEAAIEAFRATLARAGVVATVRRSRGVGEDAACGQLRVRRTSSPQR